jgi:hypothetical protein
MTAAAALAKDEADAIKRSVDRLKVLAILRRRRILARHLHRARLWRLL